MKRLLLVLFVALLTAPAASQELTARLHAGATVPAGTFADAYNPGPGLGGSITGHPVQQLGIQLGVTYDRLGLSDQAGVKGGDANILIGSFAVLAYPAPASRVKPYVKTTYGIYRVSVSDLSSGGISIRAGDTTAHSLALGAGMEAAVFSGGGVFSEVLYQVAFTEGATLKQVPVRAGVYVSIP